MANALALEDAEDLRFPDLTSMQNVFVYEFAALGNTVGRGRKAAQIAGFSVDNQAAQDAYASYLLSLPKIADAIASLTENKLKRNAAKYVANLEAIANGSGPASARVSANRDLLDRGMGPIRTRSVKPEEPEDALENLILEIDTVDVADAEFEDVPAPNEPPGNSLQKRMAKAAKLYADGEPLDAPA